MGKVFEKVSENVSFGHIIASTAKTRYLLSCGTSNWGAWALLAGLSALKDEQLLPSDEFETEVLKNIVAAGAVDAVTRQNELTVDGFPLECHLDILAKLRLTLENRDNRRLAS
ncbi:MAG: glutamate cyclase domain-containing protein [Sneathiella sp.]